MSASENGKKVNKDFSDENKGRIFKSFEKYFVNKKGNRNSNIIQYPQKVYLKENKKIEKKLKIAKSQQYKINKTEPKTEASKKRKNQNDCYRAKTINTEENSNTPHLKDYNRITLSSTNIKTCHSLNFSETNNFQKDNGIYSSFLPNNESWSKFYEDNFSICNNNFNGPSNVKNYKKMFLSKEKVLASLNDPLHPYSTNWNNRLLLLNYNCGMYFNKLELGVPLLRLQKFNKSKMTLPFINSNEPQKLNQPIKINDTNKKLLYTSKTIFSEMKRKNKEEEKNY